MYLSEFKYNFLNLFCFSDINLEINSAKNMT